MTIRSDNLQEVLQLVANPTRRQIIQSLIEKPETFSRIMLLCGLNPNYDTGTFMYHLMELMDRGVVEKRQGQYTLTEYGENIAQVIKSIEQKCVMLFPIKEKGGEKMLDEKTRSVTVNFVGYEEEWSGERSGEYIKKLSPEDHDLYYEVRANPRLFFYAKLQGKETLASLRGQFRCMMFIDKEGKPKIGLDFTIDGIMPMGVEILQWKPSERIEVYKKLTNEALRSLQEKYRVGQVFVNLPVEVTAPPDTPPAQTVSSDLETIAKILRDHGFQTIQTQQELCKTYQPIDLKQYVKGIGIYPTWRFSRPTV